LEVSYDSQAKSDVRTWDNWNDLETELNDSKLPKSDQTLRRLRAAYAKFGPKAPEQKFVRDEDQMLQNALADAEAAKLKSDQKKTDDLERIAWFRQHHPKDRRYTLISLDLKATNKLITQYFPSFLEQLKVDSFSL
jgi:hypothetical protein